MALKRVAIPSPNYSTRGGSKVRALVLHSAEGARTYKDLGAFFQNPNAGVSSHVGIDDSPNEIGEYVRRDYKAWTAANANPIAVQAELCAFAAWTAGEWAKHPVMLDNCAKWIAEEAKHYGIPIVALNPTQAQSNGRGVCQHVALGSWGGGHWDCGRSFPMQHVLDLAKGATSSPPAKPPASSTTAPPLHVDYFDQTHNPQVPDVRTWQTQMLARHWAITADGIYGPQSEQACRQFQTNKHLTADGKVGPQTWTATWQTPVT